MKPAWAATSYRLSLVRLVARRALLAVGVGALGLAALTADAWASLPQVANLQVQSSGNLTWNALPGSAGYNVYRGDVAGLRNGNYGACLLGSILGQSAAVPNDPLPVGSAVFYLVDGFDETGEGQVADPPGANPAPRCVPARRIFGITPNGDAGDGLADGIDPLRNPDILLHAMHQETSGVYLHSGEFVLDAEDLVEGGRGWKSTKGGGVNFHESNPRLIGGGGSHKGVGTGRLEDYDFPGEYAQRFDGIEPGGTDADGREGRFIGQGSARDRVAYRPDPWFCWACHSGPMLTASSMASAGSAMAARTYRSQMRYSGPLGQGWDFPANARVAASGADVVYADGAGRRETFTRLDAMHFASPAGRYGRLLQNADTSLTLREPDGSLQNFHALDGSNRAGALESAQDRQGDRSAFLYDGQGLMTTVVDPLGRAINYAYDANGRVASITDFAGRQVVYGYDAGGNLTSVRSPVVTGTPNGNDFPGGRTTTYGYSSGFADDRLNGNLILVMRPNEAGTGVPAVQNVYGTSAAALNFDRVVSQTIGGTNASGVAAGGTLTYTYQSLNPGGNPADPALPRRQATVFDRNGNHTDYVHNANGNCLTRTDFTNRSLRPGEGDYTTQFGYDSDGELILVMRPQGDRMQFVYDKPGADRYREGNLIMVRSLADPHSTGGRGDGHGGESNDVVQTFTYEPIFNQIATSIEPRGNDPTFIPQNGGANTPGRYTRSWFYDYQEADPALNGINAYAIRFGISMAGGQFALGDLNGDGITAQAAGNAVKIGDPGIHLDPASMQAAIAGGPLQVIETKIEWNGHGQPTAATDAEQNRHTFQYYPETDPDGDGIASPPPADGRILDPATGGFLKIGLIDTAQAPGRDNASNPGPINIQYDMKYDPRGTLATLIDGRGVATRYIHNALGELLEVREAAATADASGPDGTPPTGRGETGLAAPGFLTRYAYDADGNVVTAEREDRGNTRGLGQFIASHFTYDILGDLVQMDRPASPTTMLTTQYRYDANQNLTRVTEPDGNSHDNAWDERDLLLSSTRGAAGPLGGVPSTRLYDYDGDGALARLTDGRGGMVDYQYDGHGRLTHVIDPVGGSADLFYDPAGNVVRSLGRGTSGGPTPPDRSGSGNVDLADVRGLYDEISRRIRTDAMLFVPPGPPPGRPPMLTEGSLLPQDGAVNTIFEYDRLSRLTFIHKDSGALTRLDYDGAGRAMKSTDPTNDTIEWTYDAADNAVESALTELSSQPGPLQEQFLSTFFYDALGRGTMAVDNLGETTRSLYDSLDALVVASDANGPAGGSINRRSPGHTGMSVAINAHGNVTRHVYDGADRLLSTTAVLTPTGRGDGTTSPTPDTSNPANPDGLITSTNTWTGDGLPGQWVDDKGNATSYAYDNLDRLVRTTRADGTMEQINFDAEDNPNLRIDPNGTRITAQFDLAGRRMSASRSLEGPPVVEGTTLQTFEHDGLGRLTRSTDNNSPFDPSDDANVSFIYDSLGRLLEEAQASAGGGAGGGTTRYSDIAWQAADLLTGLTYPSGDQVMYGYDGAGRLTTMNDMMHPEMMATFEYIGMDRILTRQLGNGVRLTYLDDGGTQDTGYDGVGRPIRMRHLDSSNGLLAGFEYRYDRMGNNTSVRRLHDSDPLQNSRGNVYAYDSAGRLVSAREGMLDAGHTIVSPLFDQEAWSLDGPGNWANFTRNGTLYLNTPNNLNEYDEPQCCGTHMEDGIPDDFLDLASTPLPDGLNLTYDRNGNQTDTVRQSVGYNFANLPAAARDLTRGALVAAYSYDGLGRRMKRQTLGGDGTPGTQGYAYAGGLFPDAIEESDAAGGFAGLMSVGPGGGCLWHVHADGTTQYLLEDAMGSTVALVPGMSAGGPPQVLERVVYDPYGKPTFESAANVPLVNPASGTFQAESQFGNPHLFHGMRYDPELGARGTSVNSDFGGLYGAGDAYNPNEGRFMIRLATGMAGAGPPGPWGDLGTPPWIDINSDGILNPRGSGSSPVLREHTGTDVYFPKGIIYIRHSVKPSDPDEHIEFNFNSLFIPYTASSSNPVSDPCPPHCGKATSSGSKSRPNEMPALEFVLPDRFWLAGPGMRISLSLDDLMRARGGSVDGSEAGLIVKRDIQFFKYDSQFAKIGRDFFKYDSQFAKVDNQFFKYDSQFHKH